MLTTTIQKLCLWFFTSTTVCINGFKHLIWILELTFSYILKFYALIYKCFRVLDPISSSFANFYHKKIDEENTV